MNATEANAIEVDWIMARRGRFELPRQMPPVFKTGAVGQA